MDSILLKKSQLNQGVAIDFLVPNQGQSWI